MLICHSCIRPHVQKFVAGSIRHGFQSTNTKFEVRRGIAVRRNIGRPEEYRHGPRQLGYAESQELEWSKSRGASQELDWNYTRGKIPALRSMKNVGPRPSRKVLKKHMVYLEDPVKLANDVLRNLQADKYEEALELVRYASKDMPCVVSWNHLVDWQMRTGKINGAMKTYNEMKKRAQRPDSHTYTILFRGLAASAHYGSAVEKALTIYQSLTAPNSDVPPNRIHTNAVLKVCARAGAIDALFGIAAKIPTRGARAADNLTFTTILNALREYAVGDAAGRLSDEERTRLKAKTIIDGRRIWEDIIRRWRAGDLRIDEQLTCAMGRLLLLSESDKDWDDVFSLLQQTMNIPRPFPELGTPERDRHEPSEQSKSSRTANSSGEINEGYSVTSELSDADNHAMSQDEFRVVRWSGEADDYVRPGTNALSIAMEAMQKSSMRRHARSYWRVFTQEFQIEPDKSNYAGLLRVLRVLRASSDSLEVLLEMRREQFDLKHFKLALSACARDKFNPNAFATAGKILDLVQQNIAQPDIGTLSSYLEVATAGTSGYTYRKQEQMSPREIEEKFALGRRVQRALYRLQPQILNLRSYLDYGGHKFTEKGNIKAQTYSEAKPDSSFVKDAIELFARVISAYDKLLYGGMAAREERARLEEQKNLLAAVVVRLQHKIRRPRSDPKAESEPARPQRETRHGDQVSDEKELHETRRIDQVSNESVEAEEWEDAAPAGGKRRIKSRERRPSVSEERTEEPQTDYNVIAAEEDRLAAERVRREMNL